MSLDIYLTSLQTCPNCGHEFGDSGEHVYHANITHNLIEMAKEAGVYTVVWRPEDNGIKAACQLVPILEKAISEMQANPARFERHNASNGWGLYENFLPWLERLLTACRDNPGSAVVASR